MIFEICLESIHVFMMKAKLRFRFFGLKLKIWLRLNGIKLMIFLFMTLLTIGIIWGSLLYVT